MLEENIIKLLLIENLLTVFYLWLFQCYILERFGLKSTAIFSHSLKTTLQNVIRKYFSIIQVPFYEFILSQIQIFENLHKLDEKNNSLLQMVTLG